MGVSCAAWPPHGAEREQGPWLSTYLVPGVMVISTIITIISTIIPSSAPAGPGAVLGAGHG